MVAFIDSHTGKALEAGFDPNARPEGWAAGKPMAQLPPVSAFAGEIGKSLVRTLDDYASAVAAFSKAIVPAPMSQTYAQISYMPDVANSGLMQWPGLAPESLRKIVRENLAPQLVIRSRVGDIRRYAEHSRHPWKPGWRIELREASKSPSTHDRRDMRECESFINMCCMPNEVDNSVRERDGIPGFCNFSDFLAAGITDSLTFDGWAVYTDTDRDGRVKGFCNLPAGNIRLANPSIGYKGDRSVFAALVDETGTPVRGFTRENLVWSIRNPRNDPGIFQYGNSEVETAIRAIQGFQSAIDLNVDTFDKNAIPNGIMLLMGDFWTPNQVDMLMREWGNLKKGVSKQWGLPILGVPEDGDIKLLPLMDLKGTDVRYKDHLNMMAGIYCIVSGFPVRRLGFMASGNHRDNEPLPDQSTDTVGDDDPMLAPLLLKIEDILNPYIIWTRWPHLRLTFCGKNPKEDAREYEARKQARTWRESRAEADLPELTAECKPQDKPFLEIMEMCPEDPAKAGVFQSLASQWLDIRHGVEPAGEKPKVGAPFPGKKDPAKSEQQHGHASGVRRDSAKERASAKGAHLQLTE